MPSLKAQSLHAHIRNTHQTICMPWCHCPHETISLPFIIWQTSIACEKAWAPAA